MYRGRGVLDYSIPDSYVELEYIIIEENRYFVANTTFNKNYIVEFKVNLNYDNSEPVTTNVYDWGILGTVYFGTGHYTQSFFLYFNIVDLTFIINNHSYKNLYNQIVEKSIKLENYGEGYENYINDYPLVIGGYNYHITEQDNPQKWTYTTPYKHDRIYYVRVFNEDNICICNLIPVKRLGDNICGMYDTINQKFYPSDTEYQFKGGNIKTIKNERTEYKDRYHFEYQKYNNTNRIKKSHIYNAYHNLYNNLNLIPNLDDHYSSSYAIHPPYDTSIPFDDKRIYLSYNNNDNYLLNVNPNYSLIKYNVTYSNNLETYNEQLYISNKTIFSVYNTGTTIPAKDDGFL